MSRTAETIGFSISPEQKKEIEKLAKKEGMTKSELFREMIRAYKQAKQEREFFGLQRRMSKRARDKGIYTEEQVEKIVYEGR